MDIGTISSLLTNGIFPIGMCCLLFWYMTKQNEYHKAETDSLKDAIAELRVAIVTLTDKLEEKTK